MRMPMLPWWIVLRTWGDDGWIVLEMMAFFYHLAVFDHHAAVAFAYCVPYRVFVADVVDDVSQKQDVCYRICNGSRRYEAGQDYVFVVLCALHCEHLAEIVVAPPAGSDVGAPE